MRCYDHFVTMTENDPHAREDGAPQMGDPILAWLIANGIDIDRLPLFPEIELLGPEMMIEYIWGYELDPGTIRMVQRRLATHMVRRPTLVPMEPELWEMYQRARTAYRTSEALRTLGDAGATVLAAKGGAHLVFVCSNPMSNDQGFLEEASRALGEALPGVGIQIMTGVDTILHRAPQDDR